MNLERRDADCDRAYRDHAPDVYRVAYGMLRNPDEALDATHDVFARAWERWDQYDSKRPLRPWLLGICVHVCLDQLRKGRVRRLISFSATPDTHASSDSDLATDVVGRRVVEQAMASLKPEARAALVLRHYYGFEYAQIGGILGKGSGTVGSLISRAQAEMRERLNGWAGTDSTASPVTRPSTNNSDRTGEEPEALR